MIALAWLRTVYNRVIQLIYIAAWPLLFAFGANQAAAGQATIAVASNFMQPMKALAKSFEFDTGDKLTLVFGSSGKILAQIKNGAPFDVFLSADQDKVITLEKTELTVKSSRFTYAIGVLALWVPQLAMPDSTVEPTSALEVLKEGQFSRLAIANPKLAPYGAAASQTLHSLGLINATSAKIVKGENISQAYQFVSTGNADLGFVAYSQLKSHSNLSTGTYWLVPPDLHDPILQDAVVLKMAEANVTAKKFIRFLKSEPARSLIQRFGYQLPEAKEIL